MSQQYSRSKSPGGSVRRARERMEAGLPPEVPQMPPPQQPYEMRNAPQDRAKPQLPPALTPTRTGQGAIGVAISRPMPVPQWPLAGVIDVPDIRNNQPNQSPPNRGPAPQRPPRPSHVPSLLDASRFQDHTPSFQYRPRQNISEQNQTQWRGTVADEEDVRSPDISSPMTPSSRPSTISSVGTIPEFPVPVLGQSRRSGNLGPPPTIRRGASSHYSQASFVSPIPEESPRTQTTHRSFASSAAIPSSWGSEYDEADDETPEELYEREVYERELAEERGGSRGSTNDDGDERGLIRSASIGKRAKPSMIMNRSSENTEQVRSLAAPQQSSKLERLGLFDQHSRKAAGLAVPVKGDEAQRDTMWPTREGSPISKSGFPQSARGLKPAWPMAGNPSSPLADGTGFVDSSASSSELTLPTVAKLAPTNEGPPPTSGATDSDVRAKGILGAYNQASALQPPSPSAFSRLSGFRRPPKLDIDAVRDAEARGSLTSLPDLIRRATKLASMMERGKRPGSQMHDLSDFPMDEKMFEITRDYGSPDQKHRSGLSGMLAAFPPPGIATPRDGTPRGDRAISPWPEADFKGGAGNQEAGVNKRRKCCGLPCWGFIAMILILLIIIAAAIVVPLELLVFNKPKDSLSSLSPFQKCQADTATACHNGGTSLLDNGACACVCTNGFTGSTCSVAGATGCITTAIGDFNATLGDAMPRLITAAQTNFSIPLNANTLLARFSSANLSCSSENALITFDGKAQRRGGTEDAVRPVVTGTSATSTPTSQSRSRVLGRNVSKSPSASPTASVTRIFVDTAPAPTRTPTSTATTTASDAKATDKFNVTDNVLDFARVAILYVLQEEQLDNAVNAQTAIQAFFTASAFTNRAAMNVSLGNGNTINLVGLLVDLGNGNGTVGSHSSTTR